jgi:hypothetical protein
MVIGQLHVPASSPPATNCVERWVCTAAGLAPVENLTRTPQSSSPCLIKYHGIQGLGFSGSVGMAALNREKLCMMIDIYFHYEQ